MAAALLPASAVLPVQNEQIVVTCFSGTYNYYGSGSVTPNNTPTGFVVAQFNTSSGTIGSLIPPTNASPVVWTGAASAGNHNENNPGAEWNRINLGEVFGITLNDLSPPDIYVGASDVYNLQGATVSLNATAPQGPGGLYKLDSANGVVTASSNLPSVAGTTPGTGPGLGNLCFRRAGNGTGYLYVSNLDDGNIYRVDSVSLATVGTPFNHGTQGRAAEGLVPPIPDNGLAGRTPIGRRVWGVKTYQNRLYYAVCWEDSRNIHSTESNEVWSVDLDNNGDFLPTTARRRLTIPNYPDTAAGLWSNPIASIDFSPGGAMYLAERYWQLKPLGSFDLTFGAHFSRLHRFTLSGPNWVTTPGITHEVGGYPGYVPPPTTISGASSAGGVAVNCDDSLWATGDMFNGYTAIDSSTNLSVPGAYLYGAIRIQPGGNNVPPTPYGHGGFIVDYDGAYNISKLAIGAIATRRECCMLLSSSNVQCPVTPGGPYTVDVTITNLMTTPISNLQLAPCPGNQLPPGAITVQPTPATIALGSPIPPNGSATVSVGLPGVPPVGGTVCFVVNAQDNDPVEPHLLCSGKLCVDLPKCPCAVLTVGNLQCPPCLYDPHTLDLTIQNIWNTPYYWYELVPCPPSQIPTGATGVTPAPTGVQPFSPALGPNQSQTVPVSLQGVPLTGGQVCFCVRLYDVQEDHLLCEEMICVTFPACNPGPGMTLQPIGQILCPVYAGGPFKFTFTITNTQATTASGAIIGPCSAGGPGGGNFFSATPGNVTFSPALGLGQTSQNVTVCITGLLPGESGCLCVRFTDQNGRPFCFGTICFTLPLCPGDPPCLHLDAVDVTCPTASAGYGLGVNLTNNSGTTAGWYQLCPVPSGDLPAGSVTGQPQPAGLLPFNPSVPGTGGTGSIPGITLPQSVPDGANFCFLVKIYDEMEVFICDEIICIPLPRCVCATITGDVTCVSPFPNRQVTFNVTNNTNVVGTPFNFTQAVVIPTLGFSPSTMIASPNPIVPGASGTFTTTFTGLNAPRCVLLLLFNADRTKCCRVKVCPLWVECDPGPPKDVCDLANETVSEANGNTPITAWITNNSPNPRTYSWTVTPVSIPGCTGTLPGNAFTPATGNVGTVGSGSTQAVTFTINASSLAPGDCAGYEICFTAIDPVNQVDPVCCRAVVRRLRPTDPCVILNPTGRGIPTVAGNVDIIIKNPTTTAMAFDVILFETGGDTAFTFMGPPWPSNPDDICIRMSIPPGGSVPMLTEANLAVVPDGSGVPVVVDPRIVEAVWLRLCDSPQGYEILGTQVCFQPGGTEAHVYPAPGSGPLPVRAVGLGDYRGSPVLQVGAVSRPGEEYEAYANTILEELDASIDRLLPAPGPRLMIGPDGTFIGKDGEADLDLPATPGAIHEFFRIAPLRPVFGTP